MKATHFAAATIGVFLSGHTLAFSHAAFRTDLDNNNSIRITTDHNRQADNRHDQYRGRVATSLFSSFQKRRQNNASSRGQQKKPPQNDFKPQKQQSSSATAGEFDYAVAILGDLHIDPRKLQDYIGGRDQIYDALVLDHPGANHAIVSLGDLGESKNCDHNPNNPVELFSGTTLCHELAAEYLNSFQLPYEVITGNHDLEGIDEFSTDKENLDVFLRIHKKPTPQFVREIARNTLLVGLSTTIFRDAEYTSHEVVIDAAQIAWFENLLATHPNHAIFVFTHAPPSGSGLRVLQENHVVNGCCWLNQSSNHQVFIQLVRKYPTIKAWFSGHFHLGHDYQDSITFPVNANRGSCVFCQVSVMRSGTSRDGRRQSRLLRGTPQGFEICTINHNDNGKVRVDTTILYETADAGMAIYAHEGSTTSGSSTGGGGTGGTHMKGSMQQQQQNDQEYFKVYQPFPGDGQNPPDPFFLDFEGSFVLQEPATMDSIHWWYLANGRVLGIHQGILLEYDASTMAPMGLVVGSDELLGKRVAVIDSGLSSGQCVLSDEMGMEGADCAKSGEEREQAVVLIDDRENSFMVVQPNEDGSYWRKIVRNKMIRMKELRREKAAKELSKTLFGKDASRVVSSWGPYVTTSSWARKTGVEGFTSSSSSTSRR